jgi:hypothetical protein
MTDEKKFAEVMNRLARVKSNEVPKPKPPMPKAPKTQTKSQAKESEK